MKRKNLKKPMISALEQRILFDGAAVATAVDVLDNSSFTPTNDSTTTNDMTNNNAENSVHEAQAVQGFEKTRREVAFVDVTVSDYQTLVDGVGEGVETYLVSSLDEIKSILENETNIDAIHILSHGETGEITVGNDVLNKDTLQNFDAVLQSMKSSLTEDGDILLYGCNVASDGSGEEFITELAIITEADVAASDDLTGSSALGGDWDLEIKSGSIEAQSFVIDNYNDKLGSSSSYSFSTANGSSSSPAILTATGVTKTSGGTLTVIAYDVDYGTGASSDELDRVYISYDDGTSWETISWSKYYLINGTYTAGSESNNWTLKASSGGDSYLRGESDKYSKMVFNLSDFSSKMSGSTIKIKIAMESSSTSWTFNIPETTLEVFTNVKPTSSNNAIAIDEDTTHYFSVDDFPFSDPDSAVDGDSLKNITITSLPTNGTLKYYNGSTWNNVTLNQVISESDLNSKYLRFIPDSNDNGEDYATFNFKVNDGYENSISSYTLTIDVNSVNDAPTGTNKTITINEDTSTILNASDFGFNDVDGDTLSSVKITSLASNGTLEYYNGTSWQDVTSNQVITKADIDAGKLRFTPSLNENGNSYSSFGFKVNDGIVDADASNTITYNVTAVDDAPVLNVGTLNSFYGNDTSVVIAPNLTLIDPDVGDTLSGAKVQIDNFISGDVLSFVNDGSTMGSISATYNSVTGILTLSGTATTAQYEAALKSVKYSRTNTNDTDRNFSFTVGSAIPYSGNGHFYEAVYFSEGITWANAKIYAESQILYGMQGYLATITSAEENAFILSKLPADGWIGGSDAEVEGVWKWVSGPEAGQNFTYSNWNSGEPNNSGGDEDAAEFYASGSNPGKWNDLKSMSGTLQYVIVEYGGMAGDSTPIISGSGTMSINSAPVISTPATINIVDSSGASVIGNKTGTISAVDADGTISYTIDSGAGVLVNTMVGTYGTLVINSSTGAYIYTPNSELITSLSTNVTEAFIIDVSDGNHSNQTTLRINITATAESTSTYVEQDNATLILTDTSIDTEESYGGGYIEFDVSDSTTSETLGILKVTTADITDGAISIIGNTVYLGNGTSASVIGQIDSVYNGENGEKLRINFVVDFTNGNFNSSNDKVGLLSSTTNDVISIDGWTIVNGRVNLGVDTIAGLATPEDTTNPSRTISGTDKDGNRLVRGTFYTSINDDDGNSGDDNSIKLTSSLTSANGYAIIRGPYIYSDSAVSLNVGDTVSFDWKAQGGSDAYDVFGYIVDVNDPSNYQIILNRTGANTSAQTAWATESITVAKDGDYKFVFVSGSWDATGGRALGAQLYIDDVKVTQSNPISNITSSVLEKIAQKVTYQNSSDLSATNGIINKTVTVTTSSGDSTPVVYSSTKALNITEVNDSVSLKEVGTIYYVDTNAEDNFSVTTGKLVANDVDSGTVFTYGIDGATSNGDGTFTKIGEYGTLTINSVTGEYTYTPNSSVINALSTNAVETFTMNVNDGSGSSDTQTLTIDIKAANDAPLLGGTGSTPTFVENGSAVQIDSTITITDLEGTSYDGGYVTFSLTTNKESEDKLSILNVGGITVSGNSVSYGSVIIGTIDSYYNGESGKDLRINLNSNAYSPQVQALARAVAFSNPTDDLSGLSRGIEIKVNDGGNGDVTTARYSVKEVSVNIQTINDLPIIDVGNTNFIVEKSIVSNPNGELSLGSNLSISDLDGDRVTVKIETTNYGIITVNDAVVDGVNSSQISGNGTREVILTGTIEEINKTLAAINGITYEAGYGNDYITPGADYLKITATDDLGGVSVAQKLVMVLPAVPNAYSNNVIEREDNNSLINIDSLISDINDNTGTYVFGTGTADITDINGDIVTSGTITAFDSSKYIYADYDINGDGVIDGTDTSKVIGFKLTNGNLYFNNDKNLDDDTNFAQFTFIPNDNWSGVETFVYQYTSGDGKVSNIAQIAIFVTAVNDEPVITAQNSITINEDTSIEFKDINAISLTDVDVVDSNQMLDLTLNVNNGKLELTQMSGLTIIEGTNNSSIIKVQGSLADLQNAISTLKYSPNQDYNGTDSLTIKLNDRGNVGEGDKLESTKVVNIIINPINDAPTFTNQYDKLIEGEQISGVLPASDIDSNSISFSIDGNAPTGFVLNSDGSYTFDSSSYNYIGEKETDTIIIPVIVTDSEGLTKTANFAITITGVNNTPTIEVVDVVGNIIDGSKLSDNGSIKFTDLDLTDRPIGTEVTTNLIATLKDGTPLVLTQEQQQSIEEAFSIKNLPTNVNNGTISWNYDISQDKIDFLAKDETVTVVFTITVTDDEGAIATKDVTVTITGTNANPTVSAEDIDTKISFGEVYTKDISDLFSDKDLTDKFTFEAENLPQGLNIDPNTGVISGRVAQSGTFVIEIKGIDSQGASVTRTYNMLVVAPAQNETTGTTNPKNDGNNNPTNTDNNENNDNTNGGLNNFNNNTNDNLGVINYNSNDGITVDTGSGFLSTGNFLSDGTFQSDGTLERDNTGNNLDGNNQNNRAGNEAQEQPVTDNNSPSNATNGNSNEKGILQANVDLNVLNNGQVVFNQDNQDSFSIVGITIEDIKIDNNYIDIKVVDIKSAQNFIVTQIDGTPLPNGLSYDPRTGNISGVIPEDLEKLEISIKAINLDGTTRVLNLKLDLKQLKQKMQAEVNEKFIGLKEQIAFENQKLDGYGSYLTKLFA